MVLGGGDPYLIELDWGPISYGTWLQGPILYWWGPILECT